VNAAGSVPIDRTGSSSAPISGIPQSLSHP
jgi:hypothetical protein